MALINNHHNTENLSPEAWSRTEPHKSIECHIRIAKGQ